MRHSKFCKLGRTNGLTLFELIPIRDTNIFGSLLVDWSSASINIKQNH